MGEVVTITRQVAEKAVVALSRDVERLENMELDDLNSAQIVDMYGEQMKVADVLAYLAHHLCALSITLMNHENQETIQRERNESCKHP